MLSMHTKSEHHLRENQFENGAKTLMDTFKLGDRHKRTNRILWQACLFVLFGSGQESRGEESGMNSVTTRHHLPHPPTLLL